MKGKSKESKEAWLASHNFGIVHGDPWGRLDGLNGLGSTVARVRSCGAYCDPPIRRRRTESAQSTVYGMTAARGARYLLRNGLDYLNYQQYERALKFLRDAESRQKELNDAEKRALKRGIERAQRGLREAADADVPVRHQRAVT